MRSALSEEKVEYKVLSHAANGTQQRRRARIAREKLAQAVLLKDSSGFLLAVLPASHSLDMDALSPFAEPGDEVAFTIRFDNVGTETIGNVTIIDNLTTRLEYVPETAQCSIPAQFGTQVNEGDSLVLRWEITDPLEPGDGGVIRFTCRVR